MSPNVHKWQDELGNCTCMSYSDITRLQWDPIIFKCCYTVWTSAFQTCLSTPWYVENKMLTCWVSNVILITCTCIWHWPGHTPGFSLSKVHTKDQNFDPLWSTSSYPGTQKGVHVVETRGHISVGSTAVGGGALVQQRGICFKGGRIWWSLCWGSE